MAQLKSLLIDSYGNSLSTANKQGKLIELQGYDFFFHQKNQHIVTEFEYDKFSNVTPEITFKNGSKTSKTNRQHFYNLY